MPTLCIPLRRLFRRNASARQEEIVVVVLEGRKMMIFSRTFLLLQKSTKKAGPKSMYSTISALALIELL